MPLLNFQQTKKLLLKYKIPIYQTEIFNSEKKAEKFVKKIGYPVVLKIFSLTILHKTDMGGVKMNIKNNKELKKAFFDLIKIKRIEGILVQKMGAGKEIVLGMKRDFQFGPVLTKNGSRERNSFRDEKRFSIWPGFNVWFRRNIC